MTPQSVLAGVLVDESGEPVLGASLDVLRVPSSPHIQQHLSVGDSFAISDLGKFRIAGLPAGDFRVMMQNTREVGRFTVAAGQTLGNLRVVVPTLASYSITGRLSRPAPPSSNVVLQLDQGIHHGTLASDGSFRFDRIPPGDYTVIADSPRPIAQFSLETARVTITNSNVSGVQLAPPTRYTLRGRVQVKNRPPAAAAALSVAFRHRHSYRDAFSAVPVADGSFAIPNFPVGPFDLQMKTPAGTFLETIQQAGKSVKEISLDGGPVDVIFNAATAHLTGTVEPPPDDQPFRAGIVYLVPEGRWLGAGPNPERYQAFVTLDLNFSLTDLAPGRYRAVASEGRLLEGASADGFRSLGASVQTLTIPPNGRMKIVLPLIRVERIAAAGIELSH